MDELIKALKIAFASEYAFAIKTQNFHWNVEGMLFPQLHELFGKIYLEVYNSIDAFGENIRKIGSYTPASYQRFSMLSQVEDQLDILQDKDMLAQLLQDSDKMIKLLRIVYDLADKTEEHGLSNFLAERMDAHRAHSWMLRATLK